MTGTFHLEGNYAPVHEEITAVDLPVTGDLPGDLAGRYLRNGPNPRTASSHWFLGDGMVHGVRIADGIPQWYRNRWVRTDSFDHPIPPVDENTGVRNLHASVANTHVIRHAGHTLALVESSLPYEITSGLETVGCFDFGGALADSMTAHPKTCPRTGELHFFGYGNLRPPYVSYYRADAAGRITHARGIDVPAITMMHDFALTAEHVIFLDLPVVFDLEVARSGAGMPFRWQPQYGARIGVLSRDDLEAPVRWFEIDPCYVFHVANAFERGSAADSSKGTIVVQAVRYERIWDGSDSMGAAGNLWEWTLHLNTGQVTDRRLDDTDLEFPRINDAFTGRPSSRIYTVGGGAVHAYDSTTARHQSYAFGEGAEPSEMTFVPRGGAQHESDGHLIGYVFDPAREASDLVVLPADDISAGPVARVHLPVRVPNGFHGNWFADQ